MCLLIPPAGIVRIASSLLPNRHCAGTKRGEPAATGSEVQHPKSPRIPRRGEGGRPCFRIGSSGTLPQTGRVWGNSQREYGAMNATKRGCEKFLLCLIYTGSKLFAPSNKCSYSFSWPSEEEVNIFGATPHHQRKRQPMNMVPLLSTETETTAAGHCPGGKRLKRTNITACAMRDAPLAHR